VCVYVCVGGGVCVGVGACVCACMHFKLGGQDLLEEFEEPVSKLRVRA
jgi:hypothetical protein